jgi:hypothetical protein
MNEKNIREQQLIELSSSCTRTCVFLFVINIQPKMLESFFASSPQDKAHAQAGGARRRKRKSASKKKKSSSSKTVMYNKRPHAVHTGKKGGKYIISHGNKVYI